MISNEKHLLYILGLKNYQLTEILQNIPKYYHSFYKKKLDKITGKPIVGQNNELETREINESRGLLKHAQSRLYKFLLSNESNISIPDYFYGGVPGKSNVKNARYHQGHKYIFTTDIKSFFSSIPNAKVNEMFLREGCSPTVAHILTLLTTFRGHVPQGTPTSTLLSILVFKPIGNEIQKIAVKNHIKFTIFVDDVTLSASYDFKSLTTEFISIIERNGFRINRKKTHYKVKYPEVTGVICCQNGLKVPLYCRRKLRYLRAHDKNGQSLKGLLNYERSIKEA